MATATHSTGKSTAKKTTKSKSASAKKSTNARKATGQKDAVALLKADHREVEGYFSQFEKANEGKKAELAQKIVLALKVHTQLEEEMVYPASREYVKDDEIVDEAYVEHDAAKKLMAEIEAMQPSDDMFDAKVKVLQEMIEHHVEEEEKEYFPQLQKSEMDLKALGEQLMMRKKQLMGEMAPAEPKTMQ